MLERTESRLSHAERRSLVRIAFESMHAVAADRLGRLGGLALTSRMTAYGASFVTLEVAGALRGCIGTLEAHRPLAEDVAQNARRAAFDDIRFVPVRAREIETLRVKISVLSEPEHVVVESFEHLVESLRPGIDGLVITERSRRATFLPSVWEMLPGPEDFARQLQRKAGLEPGAWSELTEVARYTTEEFGAEFGDDVVETRR